MPGNELQATQLDIPNKATRAIFDKLGGPIKNDIYDPSLINLQNGEALVRVFYSGVCHTDLHAMIGDWPAPNKVQTGGGPLVGGHEGAGVVVKLGPGADEFLKVGDKVGIKWIADACLNCDYCRRGHEPNCAQAKCSGYTHDGSFQQYAVSWARYLTPLPNELPLDEAAPILCAGVTVYRALKEAKLTPGQYVAIPGAGGGLGHLAVQYANVIGCRVIAIDTGSAKKELATKLGAETFIDFKTSKDLIGDVRKASGGEGVHAAVVAASGAAAYEMALEYCRPCGKLVAVGLPAKTNIEANVCFTVFQAKQVKGSYVGNRQDAIEALDLAARGKVKTVFKTMGLSQLNDVYKAMHDGTLAGRVVLDCNK
ncbi:GroES-like protein [Tilletiaria anomala UBC 951]|uniref:alcohol dehydrogenase n=1 Tax=Tilletiaria anomala (strain ATCC 24038 / CBS 436.72 / UBC 951) TaxID=1037660 RepID=A0A066WH60_TILAU|nr:GroES-like protein [Tilletiaria anomala UBC 951]KDN50374.1 GroES-like protein [Tilletiaria anomala UBC 951]